MVKDLIMDLESVASGFIERYNVKGLPPAIGAYKHITAIKTGTNYSSQSYDIRISGMLPLNEDVEVIGEDCFEQTKKIIDNISKAIIGAASKYGLDLTKEQALNCITDTLVLLSDMSEFKQVNQAYVDEGMPFGCRAAFAVKELPLASKGVKVEIRANAVIPIKMIA